MSFNSTSMLFCFLIFASSICPSVGLEASMRKYERQQHKSFHTEEPEEPEKPGISVPGNTVFPSNRSTHPVLPTVMKPYPRFEKPFAIDEARVCTGFQLVGCFADIQTTERRYYKDHVAKEDREPMTRTLCWDFCKGVPGASVFALSEGRECYCMPFYESKVPKALYECDAVCEGDKGELCGGMKESLIYSMHDCNNLPPAKCLRRPPSVQNAKLFSSVVYFDELLPCKNYARQLADSIGNSLCEVECEYGFEVTENSLTCKEMGNRLSFSWGEFHGRAVCSPVSCGTPKKVEYSTSPMQDVVYPHKAHYECIDPGYTTTGYAGGPTSFDVQCQANRTFTGYKVCLPVQCGIAPDKPHTRDRRGRQQPLVYKKFTGYECNMGYTLDRQAHGPKSFDIVCEADGQFSDTPRCKGVTCGDIPSYTGAALVSEADDFFYPTVLDYKCSPGFSLDRKAPSATNMAFEVECQATGSESVLTSPCLPNLCGTPPPVQFSTWYPLGKILYQETVDYTCREGYTTTGEPSATNKFTITCGEGAMFSELGSCKPKQCGKAATLEDTKVIQNCQEEICVFPEIIDYQCMPGYSTKLKDNASHPKAINFTVACQASGEFEDPIKCVNIDNCIGKTCGGHGTCVDHKVPTGIAFEDWNCHCDSGYEEIIEGNDKICRNINDCPDNSSFAFECSGNGKCVDMLNAYDCECSLGFRQTNLKGSGNITCVPINAGAVPEVKYSSYEQASWKRGVEYIDNTKFSFLPVDILYTQPARVYTCDEGFTLTGNAGDSATFKVQAALASNKGGHPVPVTHYLYLEGKHGNGVDETVTGRVNLVPDATYKVSFEILRNDLGGASEYVKDVQVNGESLGGECHPDGGDYDCTYFKCPFEAKEISSTTGSVSLSITNTGHSWDCDCDKDTWECKKERTVAGLSPMKIVGKFMFQPTGGQASADPSEKFKKLDGDCYGNNRQVFNNITTTSCMEACLDDPGCAGFSFGMGTRCVLKPGVCSKTVADGWTYYEKLGPIISASTTADPITVVTQTPNPLPECLNVSCGSPYNIAHADASKQLKTMYYAKSKSQRTMTYTCYDGYTTDEDKLTYIPGASFEVECPASGEKTPAKSCVAVSCGTVPEVDHAVATPPTGKLTYPNKVEYKCDTGYSTDQSNHQDMAQWTLSCKADSTTSVVKSCLPISCGKPPEVPHGSTPQADKELVYQDKVTYKADTCFSTTGKANATKSVTLTCLPNSSLSQAPKLLPFKPIQCGNPVHMKHSTYLNEPKVCDETVEYTCKAGYSTDQEPVKGENGVTTVKCQPNGNFTEYKTCKPVLCKVLPSPTNAVLDPPDQSGLYFEKMASFKCSPGYALEDGEVDFEVPCQANGTFAEPPVCKNINDCQVPTKSICNKGGHGQCQDKENPTGVHLDDYECVCDSGFTPKTGFGTSQAEHPVSVTHFVYVEGKQGNGVDETVTGSINLVPDAIYKVSFEILRNDLGQASEYVKDVQVDGKSLGECHPDGGDYDCTFFKCPFEEKEISSATGSVSLSITNTGHSWDCDCDKDTWECHKERTVAGLSPMKIVGKFMFQPTGGMADPSENFQKLDGDCYGDNLQVFNNITTTSCMEVCLDDPGCAGFSFGMGTRCVLKPGVCSQTVADGWTYYEKLGVEQHYCQNINDCPKDACAPGTCVDLINDFKCVCPPGYHVGSDVSLPANQTCAKQTCGDHPTVGNATANTTEALVFKDVVEYTCNVGYTLTGVFGEEKSFTVTCGLTPGNGSTGTFSTEYKTNVCKPVTCGIPDEMLFTDRSTDHEVVYPHTVVYSCVNGYSLDRKCSVDVVYEMKCTSNGTFQYVGSQQECKSVLAGSPKPLFAQHKPGLKPEMYYPEVRTMTCDEGYSIDGKDPAANQYNLTAEAECTIKWPANCTIMQCGKAPPQANCQADTGDKVIEYEGVVTYTADSCYSLSGNASGKKSFKTECLASGKFSANPDDFPFKKITCGRPPVVEHAHWTETDQFCEDKVRYVCDVGYSVSGTFSPSGSSFTITCQNTGKFTEGKVCKPVTCGDAREFQNTELLSKGSHVFQDKVSYKCLPGYSTDGKLTGPVNFSTTCQSTGKYSAPEKCINMDDCESSTQRCGPNGKCKDKANPTGVVFDDYECICDSGFEPKTMEKEGEKYRTCGNIPDCPKNACLPGSCQDLVNDYKCHCPNGYHEGKNEKEDLKHDCMKDTCGKALLVKNAANLAPEDDLFFLDNTTYQCNEGYSLDGSYAKPAERQFTSDCALDENNRTGFVPGSDVLSAKCKPVQCGTPPRVNYAKASTRDVLVFEDKVVFTCEEGYSTTGECGKDSFTMECNASGAFTFDYDACLPVLAGKPDIDKLKHSVGHFDLKMFYGDSIDVDCEVGYSLDENNVSNSHFQLKAEGDCTISGYKTCVPVSCGVPKEVTHAACDKKSDKIVYPNTVTWTTETGYTDDCSANGTTTFTAQCTAQGNFSSIDHYLPIEPICCGAPAAKVGAKNPKSEKTFMQTVTYTCKEGWSTDAKPATSTTQKFQETCLKTGLFSDVGNCEPIECPTVPAPQFTKLVTNRSEKAEIYKDILVFKCLPGYSLDGSLDGKTDFSVKCLATGEFSDAAECKNIDDCVDSTCSPNGKCEDNPVPTGSHVSDYTCKCDAGFKEQVTSSGRTCENIDDCKEDFCHAENGDVVAHGICHDLVLDYKCTCPAGSYPGNDMHDCVFQCCGDLPIVKNSEKKKLGKPRSLEMIKDSCEQLYGETFLYTCAEGYTVDSTPDGASTFHLQCEQGAARSKEGKRTGLEECKPVDCGSVPRILNAVPSTTSFVYPEVVVYQCAEGFSTKGTCDSKSSLKMSCSSDGNATFDDSEAVECIANVAGTPLLDNAMFLAVSMSYNQSQEVTCDSGYSTNATEITANTFTLQTTPACGFAEHPTCVKVSCGTAPTVKNATATGGSLFGDEMSYTCQIGFSLDSKPLPVHSGTSATFNLRCQANGTFEEPQACKPVECPAPPKVDFATMGDAPDPMLYIGEANHAVPITHYVYKAGTLGNGVDETVTDNIDLVPNAKYTVSFEILRNDLGQASEYVKNVQVDGESLGECHPDGGDYDCTFFQCPFAAKEISSTTGSVSLSITNTGHSWDCDCDTATWECKKEGTVAGLSPMKIVGKFVFQPTATPDTYVIDPSPASCPVGEALTEKECASLDGTTVGGQLAVYVEAGNWANPESCGCYFNQRSTNSDKTKPEVYYNFCRDGLNSRPDSGEISICKKKVTTPAAPEQVEYKCDTGYSLDAKATGTTTFGVGCSAYGELTGLKACLPIECPDPKGTKGNATLKQTDGLVVYGENVTYLCDAGYSLTGEPSDSIADLAYTEECQADGTFTNKGKCVDINFCLTGPGHCGEGGKCQDQLLGYTCKCGPGYEAQMVAPEKDSAVRLMCVELDECDTMNGTESCTSHGKCQDGIDKFTCNCDPGYKEKTVVKGKSETCEPIMCHGIPKVENSNSTLGGKMVPYPTILGYTCNNGFSTTGKYLGDMTFSLGCQTDGSFKTLSETGEAVDGAFPECKPVECEDLPTVGNATVTGGPAMKYTSEAAVYKCNAGYTLSGTAKGTKNFTVTCQDNGELTELSSCKPVMCGSSPDISFASAPAQPATMFYSASKKYTCDKGYTLDGEVSGSISFSVTCEANGSITGSKQCNPVSCGAPPKFDYATSDGIPKVFGKSALITCDNGYTTTGEASDPTVTSYFAVRGRYRSKKQADQGFTDLSCLNKSSSTGLGKDVGTVCCDSNGEGSRPGCKTGDYSTAEAHCASEGMTLCSVEQLINGAGRSTGCSFNSGLVWSSTACSEAPSPSKFSVDCEADGKYSQHDGCKPVSCGTPVSLGNGTPVTTDEVVFPNKASWQCKEGYNMNGKPGGPSEFELKCRADGKFQDPIGCVDIDYCDGDPCGPGQCYDCSLEPNGCKGPSSLAKKQRKGKFLQTDMLGGPFGTNGDYACDCWKGYETSEEGGLHCTEDDCHGNPCGVGGYCIDLSNLPNSTEGAYTCSCKDGYFVSEEGKPECLPVVCAKGVPTSANATGKFRSGPLPRPGASDSEACLDISGTYITSGPNYPQDVLSQNGCAGSSSKDGWSFTVTGKTATISPGDVTGSIKGKPGDYKITWSNGIKYTPQGNFKVIYQDRIVYTCLPGFSTDGSLESRTFRVICAASGSLVDAMTEGSPPECVPVICGSVPNVSLTTHSWSSGLARYGDAITYTCEDGYVADSETMSTKFTVTCAADRKFSGLQTCQPKSCGELAYETPNAMPSVTLGTVVYYPDFVTYTCDQGYQTPDNVSMFKIACTAEGKYSANGTCLPMFCEGGLKVGESRTIQCPPGKTVSGSVYSPHNYTETCSDTVEIEGTEVCRYVIWEASGTVTDASDDSWMDGARVTVAVSNNEPVSDEAYLQTNLNEKCPLYTDLKTEEECKIAATALGLTSFKTKYLTEKPRYCYYGEDGTAYFNTAGTSALSVPIGTHGAICYAQAGMYSKFRVVPPQDVGYMDRYWRIKDFAVYTDAECSTSKVSVKSSFASSNSGEASKAVDSNGRSFWKASNRYVTAESEWVGFETEKPVIAKCIKVKQRETSTKCVEQDCLTTLRVQGQKRGSTQWVDIVDEIEMSSGEVIVSNISTVVHQVSTNVRGGFNIDLGLGSFTLKVSNVGYVTYETPLVVDQALIRKNRHAFISLSKRMKDDEFRIVLQWAKHSLDLDMHLIYGPGASCDRDRCSTPQDLCETYYANMYTDSCPGANGISAELENDDRDGIGPETIRIGGMKKCVKSSEYDCKMIFFVDNYTPEDHPLGESRAEFYVYGFNMKLGHWTIPVSVGSKRQSPGLVIDAATGEVRAWEESDYRVPSQINRRGTCVDALHHGHAWQDSSGDGCEWYNSDRRCANYGHSGANQYCCQCGGGSASSTANVPTGYVHYPRGCVNGNNIRKYRGKTVQECAEICDATSACVAFEYGVAYGGSGRYQPMDCQPQRSQNSANCDGSHYNLDLYTKESADNSCQWARDGTCDETQYCPRGTDCSDCGTC